MEFEAIKQASRRAIKAEEAIEVLKLNPSYDDFFDAWEDFLMMHHGAYEKLKAGVGNNAKALAWYEEINKKRNEDPLLRYVRHARNAEYHGLEHAIEKVTTRGLLMTKSGALLATKSGGLRTTKQTVIRLVRVNHKKSGNITSVPETHKGASLSDKRPVTIAMLALEHLHKTLAEAKILAAP